MRITLQATLLILGLLLSRESAAQMTDSTYVRKFLSDSAGREVLTKQLLESTDFTAKEIVSKAYELFQQPRDQFYFLVTVERLYGLEDPEQSLLVGYEAMKIARELREPEMENYAAMGFGGTLVYLGNYDSALKVFSEIQERVARDGREYFNLLVEMGLTYLSVGDLTTAKNYMIEGLLYYESVGDHRNYFNTLYNLGDILIEREAYDSAISLYLQVINNVPIHRGEELINPSKGQIARSFMLKGAYNEAIRWQREGLAGERKIDAYSEMIDSHSTMAAAFVGLGEMDSASYHFGEALRYASRFMVLEKMLSMYQLQSRVYAEAGYYEKAFLAGQRAATLADSVKGIQIREIQLDLREKYETEKKEAENVLLTEQNEVQRMFLIIVVCLFLIALGTVIFIYRLQKKTQRLNEMISSQSVQLNQLNQTKDRLFSIISHDLRGPISAFESVASLVQNFLNKGDIRKVEEIVVQVEKSSKNLRMLLDNLLNWSLSQQGGITIVSQSLALPSLVDEVLDTLAVSAEAKNIKFIREIENISVYADYDTLTTALRNLISNAIKFSPFGAVITVAAVREGEEICVRVIDQGLGIPSDQLSKLFKVDKSKVRKGTAREAGTGLGLILVKEFVEMNQGKLSVASTEGEGSTFTIRLPTAV